MSQTTPSNIGAFGIESGHKKFDLTLGEPHLSPFPLEILADLVPIKGIHRYYSASGSESLREAIIAKFYPGFRLENIAITHGAIGALDIILRSIGFDEGAEILLPDPGFPPYEKLAEFSKLKIKKYSINLDHDHSATLIDWNQLATQITPETKIILINSPNNPTGGLFTNSDKQQLSLILKEYPNLHFIMDEVYRELIFSESEHSDLTVFLDRGYIVGSFSKMYPLHGARIGWVLTNKKSMQKVLPILNNAFGAISSFGQELAELMIKRESKFIEAYHDARSTAEDILTYFKIPYTAPQGGLFYFLNFNIDDKLAAKKLHELGVAVVPGSAFGRNGSGYVRLCFAQSKKDLQQAMVIVAQQWHSLQADIK